MKETTQQLFARAADAIEAADILLTNDKVDFPQDALITQCFTLLRLC